MPRPARILRWSICAALAAGGCAGPKRPTTGKAFTLPAGAPGLALEDLGPAPELPAPAALPAEAGDRPPAQALLLFARGRAALDDGDRPTAVSMFEQAAAVDPYSFELWYELGKARSTWLGHSAAATSAFLKAAELEPDHLDVQLELGRQLLAAGDGEQALHRLRLATRTSQYRAETEPEAAPTATTQPTTVALADVPPAEHRAAEADYLLAQALADLGYDRAALDRFEFLARRLDREGGSEAGGSLLPHATARLHVQIGDLYLRRDDPAAALLAYRKADASAAASDAAPDPLVQGRIVRALLSSGRADEALAAAADGVRRANASTGSVDLLREAYRLAGRPAGAAAAALADLHRKHPDDRPILFALCQLLADAGDARSALKLMADVRTRAPADAAVVCRQAILARDVDGAAGAVEVLARALAGWPQLDGQLDPAFRALSPATGKGTVSPATATAVPVPPGWAAARAYVAARLAVEQDRAEASRRFLVAATAGRPAFAPAFRLAIDEVLDDADLPRAERSRRAISLAERAKDEGAIDLFFELRAREALFRGEGAEAARWLAGMGLGEVKAGEVMAPAPAVALLHARASAAAGELSVARAALQELATRAPLLSAAHADLVDQWEQAGDEAAAERALAAWERAIPDDFTPRSRRAEGLLDDSKPEAAELLLAEYELPFAADPRRLELLADVYVKSGRADRFAPRLEAMLGETDRLGPRGLLTVALRLATAYLDDAHPADAARVLENARPLAAGDPDRLRDLAALFRRADADDAADVMLGDAITADPADGDAMAALAASLAERGRDLPRAEALARAAVAADGARPSRRAALGWALYRQGKFAPAKVELATAVSAVDEDLAPAHPAGAPAHPAGAPADHATAAPATAAPPSHAPQFATAGPVPATLPTTLPTTAPAEPDPENHKHDPADPVLLDHLGDALYRLGERDAAARSWDRALRRLATADPSASAGTGAAGTAAGGTTAGGTTAVGTTANAAVRSDLQALRLTLAKKLQQLRAGHPVTVAATVP